MEVDKVRSSNTITSTTNNHKEAGEDDVPLPGFRFHPTDEELVGFYLRRKVEKRPIRIELIKQADIYKYDPWDLPKSSDVGDKEWYFFCKRGRKYRNSIRPNRVTGSGFWKATGIDKPIYSSGAGECIGLKKSLVYYRGSAGKGTKTDWMMHEFRLPAGHDKSTKTIIVTKTVAQEAEVWTLCRIFKRNISYRKCVPDWSRQVSAKRNTLINPIIAVDHAATSQTCSIDSSDDHNRQGGYISFGAPAIRQSSPTERKPYSAYNNSNNNNAQSIIINANQQHYFPGHFSNSSVASEAPCSGSSFSSPVYADISELLRVVDWEDLRSVADCGDGATPFYL